MIKRAEENQCIHFQTRNALSELWETSEEYQHALKKFMGNSEFEFADDFYSSDECLQAKRLFRRRINKIINEVTSV